MGSGNIFQSYNIPMLICVQLLLLRPLTTWTSPLLKTAIQQLTHAPCSSEFQDRDQQCRSVLRLIRQCLKTLLRRSCRSKTSWLPAHPCGNHHNSSSSNSLLVVTNSLWSCNCNMCLVSERKSQVEIVADYFNENPNLSLALKSGQIFFQCFFVLC